MDIKKILLSAATITGILTAGTIAANADTVTVKAGDTVSHIASENNTTVSSIEKANGLSDINLIFVGQQLEVGGSTNNAAQTTTTETPQAPAANAAQPAQNTQAQAQAPVATQQQPAQAQAKTAPAVNNTQTTQNTQQQKPAVNAQPAQSTQTQAKAPVATQQQPAQQQTTNTTTTSNGSSEEAAKNWIANRESSGSYTATNGQYYGKYQLSRSYLNGDYSAANQERVANQYVQQRYGSWANAQKHSQQTGWY
ncbi:LysM peptidoglycan-binding domain-containing protein [Liquorilactobacillus capillatus]|uniref:Peptidoglycan binding protein, lysm domain protein n=1 Tax=Liquorilactobacillus capillatus DSM 19910 TaxID=1423731 RepID=A0A0R1MGX4_9LACO|nr:LysM peptidoglycan-binding domain-containing protein [Liquorilactobacillus capillatus]KRL03619.1 peptidoglycan binding protein, lysm domain protein [Liquorilactobacillus capillatus DSM 19910]